MTARQMARVLGQRGGIARARRLSPDERRRIAALGGDARRQSRRAERQVIDNFRYLASVVDLQGGAADVERLRAFDGPLPGIYRQSP